MKLSAVIALGAILILGAADLVQAAAPPAREPWQIPFFRARRKNPTPADAKSIAIGKSLYTQQCLSCHGAAGKGDGTAAKDLEVSPGDLSAPKMWSDTDGALFWKMTEGRKPMQSFETLLNEEQRWNVVNYIRTLAPPPAPPALAAAMPYRQAISAVLKPYYQLETALAGASVTAAKEGATALVAASAALGALKVDDLDAKAKSVWVDAAAKLAAAVPAVAAAKDLDTMRSAFHAASDAVVALVEQFGHNEPHAVLLFRCAEGPQKTPGAWLQDFGTGLSPFTGRSDPECAKPVKVCAAAQTPAAP
jgi:mono/diheme cytochrome c family protein